MIQIIKILKFPIRRHTATWFSQYSLFLPSFYLVIFLSLFSCRERVTPPDNGSQYKPSITISAEDVGVTDAFIRLKFLDTVTTSPKTFLLTRDGKPLMTNTLITNDTLLIDEGLLPKRTYTYKAYLHSPSASGGDSSAPLHITTMDTTSHNFTWQIDTLGDGAGSVLRDVCIINDTCVWAVGEIYKKDSTGNFDPEPFGAARWDGKKWHLMKVSYRDFGSTTTWPGKLKAVYGFSPDNIYVASSANLLKWNGTSWQEKAFFMTDISWNGRVNKIWGTNDNNLYLVGDNGAIYCYNGVAWRRLESGTVSNIQDVWGIFSKTGNNEEVFCAVSSLFIPGDQKILKITYKSNKIDSIPWGTGRNILSVWTENGKIIYTAGSGVFENTPGYWREATLPSVYTNQIRGTSRANIFVVGDFGLVAHHNGKAWNVFNDVFNAQYFSLSVNDNMVVCVGQRDGKGIVSKGRKK